MHGLWLFSYGYFFNVIIKILKIKMQTQEDKGINYTLENEYVPCISGSNIANIYDDVKIEIKHKPVPVENCWDDVCMNNKLDGEKREMYGNRYKAFLENDFGEDRIINRNIKVEKDNYFIIEPSGTGTMFGLPKSDLDDIEIEIKHEPVECELMDAYTGKEFDETVDKIVLKREPIIGDLNIEYTRNENNLIHINKNIKIKQESQHITESRESLFVPSGLQKTSRTDLEFTNVNEYEDIEIKPEPLESDDWKEEYTNKDNARNEDNLKYINRIIKIKQESQCITESCENFFVPCDLQKPSKTDIDFTNVNEYEDIEIKPEPLEFDNWKEENTNKDNSYQSIHIKEFFSNNSNFRQHSNKQVCDNLNQTIHFDKAFTKNDQVLGNLGAHTGEKAYQCKNCDKYFTDDYKLKIHLRTHTEEIPFECSHCEKTFSIKQHLRCHLKIHAKEKLFQYHTCDKSFSDSSNHIKHLKTHSEENLYQCSQCDKPFLEGSRITREKRNLCGQCNKEYSKNSPTSKKSRSPRKNYKENHFLKQSKDCQVIYIDCIAEGTTSEIRDRFKKFGTIKNIFITFRGQRNNYGFITFKDQIEAYQAIEYGNDDTSLPQYYICSKKEYEEDILLNQGDHRVIYVGCITDGTTKVQVRERFAIFGTIIDISLFFRGQRNNYCYIRYKSHNEALKTMKHGNDDTSFAHYYLCLRSRRKYEEDELMEKQKEDHRVIYIGCISDGTTKSDIRNRFSKFGTIVDISLIFSGQRNNFGFITYNDHNEAYKAINHGNDDISLHQYYLSSKKRYDKDKVVNVKQADDYPDIYIGCISEGTTKAELRDRFNKFGTIRHLSIIFRGQRNNYGHIRFTNRKGAFNAIEHGNDDTSLPQYYLCLRGSSRYYEEENFMEKQGEDRKIIYISRIAEDTTNIELRNRFRKFGTITYISLISQEKGNYFSFIAFKTHDEAYKAIKHGNDDTSLPHYHITLGGRRVFYNTRYSDLDAQNPVNSGMGIHRSGDGSERNEESMDFDDLLRAAMKKRR